MSNNCKRAPPLAPDYEHGTRKTREKEITSDRHISADAMTARRPSDHTCPRTQPRWPKACCRAVRGAKLELAPSTNTVGITLPARPHCRLSVAGPAEALAAGVQTV